MVDLPLVVVERGGSAQVPLSHDKRDWLYVEGSFHRWKARWCIVQNS